MKSIREVEETTYKSGKRIKITYNDDGSCTKEYLPKKNGFSAPLYSNFGDCCHFHDYPILTVITKRRR